MYFRAILSGTLAAFLFAGTAAFAQPTEQDRPGIIDLLPKFGLPGVFGAKKADETVRYAQASDPRLVALEEQIRSLSGTIEELNFQILQMQEQMRKMQEDNEFRFQELEKRSDAKGKSNRNVAEAPTAERQPPAGGGAAAPEPGSVEGSSQATRPPRIRPRPARRRRPSALSPSTRTAM